MIIIDAARRSLTDVPLAIRCQPYEHDFETLDPDYSETMIGSLGTSPIPGLWRISFKVQMAASDINAIKMVALANKAPEEVVVYWMQFPVSDYGWWRRRSVPSTVMSVRLGLLCEYYPAILGVVTVKQTRVEGCYKEFEVSIVETRRLSPVVGSLAPDQFGIMTGSVAGAQTIHAALDPSFQSVVQVPATTVGYSSLISGYASSRVYRMWMTLSDGTIALDSGWMNEKYLPSTP